MSLTDQHHKHAIIPKKSIGRIFATEWAIIGAPCDRIKMLSDKIIQSLSGDLTLAYYDATHKHSQEEPPGHWQLMDQMNLHSCETAGPLKEFDLKIAFNHVDLGLINGNHFSGDRQIVIINQKKRDSLKRKMDRLTNIGMIVLDEGESDIYDFLNDHLEKQASPPIFKIDETDRIAEFIRHKWYSETPSIKGLVLTGGESKRMGRDKSKLEYHGMSQKEFMLEQITAVGIEAFVSARTEQEGDDSASVIYDSFTGLGPFGAILSAFRSDPNAAWLVVACDQPLLKSDHLEILIQNRRPRAMATCFFNPKTGWPEPLITIWEPKSYGRLLNFLALGYSCPRKVLINSDAHVIHVEDASFMENVNTEFERKKVLRELIK